MIIRIDHQYENLIMQNGPSNEESDGLERILEQMRDKKLFLFISRQFCKYLLCRFATVFSSSVLSMLRNLYENHTILCSEASNAVPLIVLMPPSCSSTKRNGVAYMPIKDIPTDIKAHLVCENTDDASFYMKLFNWTQSQRIKELTDIDKESYGGSGRDVLCNWFSRKMPCLVICDSDIKYPGCSLGATAKMVGKVFSDENPLLSELIVLSVHEKENLFPWELLKPHKDPKVRAIVSELVSRKAGNNDLQDYFDIKDGITWDDVRSSDKESGWESLYRPIIQFGFQSGIQTDTGQSPRDKFFHGISSSGLDNLIPYFVDKDLLMNKLTPNQRSDLTKIFRQILRFGYRYSEITS